MPPKKEPAPATSCCRRSCYWTSWYKFNRCIILAWRNISINEYYKGKTKVNVAARWSKGFKNPIFIVTNLENSEIALDLYFDRMKIEESFNDFKSRIGLDKIMSKKESNMQKLFFIAMLAYMVLAVSGETIRDNYFPQRKKRFYSGIFIILHPTNFGIEIPVVKIREFILSYFKNEMCPRGFIFYAYSF